jgi:hypothetical protein
VVILGIDSYCWLVVTGTMEWIMTFHSVGNGIIIPTDELHHFSEGLVETTNQIGFTKLIGDS